MPLANMPRDCILVSQAIRPDWLLYLKQSVGVITEQGGMTSHGAILARELGLPAVIGVPQATQVLRTGDWVLVDGDRGQVYQLSTSDRFPESRFPESRFPESRFPESRFPEAHLPESRFPEAHLPESHLSAAPNFVVPLQMATPAVRSPIATSAIATQLMVTLSQVNLIAQAQAFPVDGVGLLRSELMILDVFEGRHPRLWQQQNRQTELINQISDRLGQFAQAFAPRPVFYRSLDLRSHEFSTLAGGQSIPETNPVLGVRGTLSYQLDSTAFEIELAALRQVQQRGYPNLHLILPFVRTVEEFVFCRQWVERAGLTLCPGFQLWIMAEVPSILVLLPQYIAAGVQGVAIGSNDLTQLLLGADRDQPQLSQTFAANHPVVRRSIQQIIETTQQAQIPCSICGQAPVQHPEMIDDLVRWGITAISVEPQQVEATYGAIVRAEQRLILEAARRVLRADS